MVTEEDDNLIDFDPKYPYILPDDWKEKNSPSVYEILATTNTLKRMYADKVKEIEEGVTSNKLGEEALRNIATNYQTIKLLLFQSRQDEKIMNLSQFNEEIRSLDKDFLQSILDGSALLMVEDQSLGLGSSNGAFVIFWIEDEVFSSVEDLRSYLAEEAEDLHANYYKHSPISKEYFEAKLSSLMDEYGLSLIHI